MENQATVKKFDLNFRLTFNWQQELTQPEKILLALAALLVLPFTIDAIVFTLVGIGIHGPMDAARNFFLNHIAVTSVSLLCVLLAAVISLALSLKPHISFSRQQLALVFKLNLSWLSVTVLVLALGFIGLVGLHLLADSWACMHGTTSAC